MPQLQQVTLIAPKFRSDMIHNLWMRSTRNFGARKFAENNSSTQSQFFGPSKCNIMLHNQILSSLAVAATIARLNHKFLPTEIFMPTTYRFLHDSVVRPTISKNTVI